MTSRSTAQRKKKIKKKRGRYTAILTAHGSVILRFIRICPKELLLPGGEGGRGNSFMGREFVEINHGAYNVVFLNTGVLSF